MRGATRRIRGSAEPDLAGELAVQIRPELRQPAQFQLQLPVQRLRPAAAAMHTVVSHAQIDAGQVPAFALSVGL